MIRRIRKACELKVRPYADLMIDINGYLAAFTGGKASDNIGETELKEIILNSMKNERGKKMGMHCFDCETITFKSMLTCLNTWKSRGIFMKVM